MMLGMSLSSFTLLHVLLSIGGMISGAVVAFGLLESKRLPGWTALFFATTILTSVTGFMFPFVQFLPSHLFGVISLVVLALALAGYYFYRLAGAWRWIYLATALLALYLNTFVGVVQAFLKIGPLNRLAPTQSELPFVLAQGVLLLVFIVLFVWALRVFRPAPLAGA